jgi:O-antigen/teichoic acid export membrane protein
VVIGLALKFFTSLCVYTLIATKKNRAFVVASTAGLAVNVIANLFVIPRYSYQGAAVVTVATELIVLAVLVRAVASVPGLGPPPWPVVSRAIGAATGLAATGIVLGLVVPWPVAALGAAAVFVGILHFVGVDGPGGLRVLPRLLREPPARVVDVPAHSA